MTYSGIRCRISSIIPVRTNDVNTLSRDAWPVSRLSSWIFASTVDGLTSISRGAGCRGHFAMGIPAPVVEGSSAFARMRGRVILT